MHFALPPRKSAHPPPYARSSRSSILLSLRQRPIQITAIVAFIFFIFYLLLSSSSAISEDGVEIVPAGAPKVVIVTVLDEMTMTKEYMGKIKANREDYAQRHGYANFFTNTTAYLPYLGSAPASWSSVAALRHALTLYPHTPWFFSLSPHSMIMTPSVSLHDHILSPSVLGPLMLKDVPVVPPDSVIHTFSHLKPEKVDLILTQDADSLCHGSLLLRRGEWAKFFLDSWMDSLYRSYNFQKAEGHALEHLVQWHPTILSHLALVPQHYLNAYNFEGALSHPSSTTDPNAPPPQLKQSALEANGPSLYSEGDFLVRCAGCDAPGQAASNVQIGPGGVIIGGATEEAKKAGRTCEKEFETYYMKWRQSIARLDGKHE